MFAKYTCFQRAFVVEVVAGQRLLAVVSMYRSCEVVNRLSCQIRLLGFFCKSITKNTSFVLFEFYHDGI